MNSEKLSMKISPFTGDKIWFKHKNRRLIFNLFLSCSRRIYEKKSENFSLLVLVNVYIYMYNICANSWIWNSWNIAFSFTITFDVELTLMYYVPAKCRYITHGHYLTIWVDNPADMAYKQRQCILQGVSFIRKLSSKLWF